MQVLVQSVDYCNWYRYPGIEVGVAVPFVSLGRADGMHFRKVVDGHRAVVGALLLLILGLPSCDVSVETAVGVVGAAAVAVTR